MILYYLLVLIIGIPLFIFWPAKVVNRKYRPKRGKGALICCNHLTLLDPLIVGMHIPRRLWFVAKKEYADSFFGKFMVRGSGSFPIDRGKPNLDTMKRMIAVLKKGKAILLFPEGTRNKGAETDGLLALQNGAVMLSVKSQVPVYPVALLKRPRFLRFNKIIYGEPIEFTELYGEMLTREKLDAATQRLAESMEGLKQIQKKP